MGRVPSLVSSRDIGNLKDDTRFSVSVEEVCVIYSFVTRLSKRSPDVNVTLAHSRHVTRDLHFFT